MKTFKRRDSATTVLRKLGVKSSDYSLFIEKIGGLFQLDIEKAEKFIKASKSHDKRVGERRSGNESCCGVAYAMILDGATNAEVWAVIQPKFNLGENKRHYPSWYRCHLRRIGKLGQDTRVRHQNVVVIYE